MIRLIGSLSCIQQLSRRAVGGTSRVMTAPPPVIFDRAARRLRRDRMARGTGSPLEQEVAQELGERLSAVTREFASALVINSGHGHMAAVLKGRGILVTETDHGARFATQTTATLCEEDRLSVPPESFDLVVMPSGLDTVDDVPGALIAARRALRPGGLFLGCLIGAPSLPVLRDALRAADAKADRAVARLHPQIDVRGAGDLLVRSGFALPVADAETLRLSYRSLDRLLADIRSAGLGNVLYQRERASRKWLASAKAAFARAAVADGTTVETVTLLVLTGWAPEALDQH